MKDFDNNEESTPRDKGEIKITHGDLNAKKKPVDDAFKTSGKKHKQEWAEPMDEQQFDDQDLGDKN